MNKTQCQICGRKCNGTKGLGSHLKSHNITLLEHYNKFFKQKNEGICLLCKSPTKWCLNSHQYRLFCSPSCASRARVSKRKQTCLNRYGHVCSMHGEAAKLKTKQTIQNKFKNNTEYHKAHLEKAKKTNLKRYGTECVLQSNLIKEKIKKTNLQRYGVPYCLSLPEIQEKRKVTFIERYGCEYPLQNQQFFDKQAKYRKYEYKLPSGKIIYKQGYEPYFLDFVFNNNYLKENEIIYQPKSIRYKNKKGTISYYYPDFQIPKYNLIVEVKSSYTFSLDKNIEYKKIGCEQKGFNFILFIDNNYKGLVNIINETNE